MSDDRYLIISADAHAGLPPRATPYLDAAYHPQFDDYLRSGTPTATSCSR